MPFASVNNLKTHYLQKGNENNRPLVLLHGFTLDHRMWDDQLEFFSQNYLVIIPDARGHGLSEAPQTNYARTDRVEDLLALINYFGFDKIDLVGLSMGGSTAIGFALKHQVRLNSMTLVDTGAAGFSPGKKFSIIDKLVKEKGLKAGIEKWIAWTHGWYKDDQEEVREKIEMMMREHSGAVWLDEMRGKYPRTIDLDNVNNIKIPVLIMCGENDRIFVPLAKQLHEKIDGSVLKIIANSGHMLNMEQPEVFNMELNKFLETTTVV